MKPQIISSSEVPNSKLRTWRLREQLTLEDMADLTGFTAAMLSLVENGKRRLSLQGKIIVARRLKVPLRELFEVEPISDERELVAR